jgi:acyl-coenzyme A thioesterase PaaI-like protein
MPQTPANQTLLNWDRHPRSDGFNELTPLDFLSVSPGAGVANTTIQDTLLVPGLFKIRKVGVAFSAVNSVAGTAAFNIVVGTTGAYTQGVIAPNDNSYSSGTAAPSATTATNGAGVYVNQAGAGYPTNVATAGMAVFSADITLAPASTTAQQAGAATNSTFAPGWISATTTGGYGIFVPPNYDAVYPMLVPLTLRASTAASVGTITSLRVVMFVVLVTPLANPGSGSTTAQPFCIPGQSY